MWECEPRLFSLVGLPVDHPELEEAPSGGVEQVAITWASV